jgi:enoyl-CoA hydratase
MTGEIRRKLYDKTLVLVVDNPAILNAFSGVMAEDLIRALQAADHAPEVRVIIVTGAGERSFSSGEDLSELAAFTSDEGLGNTPFLMPRKIRKPVIAAINGHCIGAGLILAMSCDLRVAAENATFASTGAKLGGLPGGQQLDQLPALLGRTVAMEMMLTAAPMSAERFMAAGFLNRLTPVGQALQASLDLADTISRNSPTVLGAVKQAVALFDRLDSALVSAHENLLAQTLRAHPDAREGMEAFWEKRPPRF